MSGAGVSEEPGSGRDVADDEIENDDPDEDAAGSDGAESMQAAATERASGPRRSRRSTSAAADKLRFIGVDTSAVRAWAAANGLTVSPRGRIKDEVLQAYRDAGN